jgi:hypothetical protein
MRRGNAAEAPPLRSQSDDKRKYRYCARDEPVLALSADARAARGDTISPVPVHRHAALYLQMGNAWR